MKVVDALICDSVRVREGLLFILGGGVTRIYREAYPAPLGCDLAVRLMLTPEEAAASHRLGAQLLHDGEKIAEIAVTFNASPAQGDPLLEGEELNLSVAMPFMPAGVPGPGAYTFDVRVDDVSLATVPFRALIMGGQDL